MNSVWQEIAVAIKSMHKGDGLVPLHEPCFAGNEEKYVADCIRSGWVSSVGQYVDDFEKKLADFVGVKRAVAVVNGTAALHLALLTAGVQPGDEVCMPSLSFVATANAVAYCQAIPHFCDVSEVTLGLDPDKLDHYLSESTTLINGICHNKVTGRIIRAVVPMHTFGHPVEMDRLIAVCERYNLILIEDAAESLGSYYKGMHTGSFGKLSAFSFNGNKIITTGGGGAVLTNDSELADYAKHISTTAKVPHRWHYDHDEIGFNYRLPNINAALGCAQMETLARWVELKRSLADKYRQLFEGIEGVRFFVEPSHSRSNYWLNTLLIDKRTHSLEEVLGFLNDNQVMSRPVWKPLHLQSPYRNCPRGDLTATEHLQSCIINLPSSPNLGA